MSLVLQAAVWQLDLPSPRKLVLAVMCDCAGKDDGSECYPSHGLIAQRTGLSLSTVKRMIVELMDMSIVTRVKVGGGRFANNYRIDITTAPKLKPLQRRDRVHTDPGSPVPPVTVTQQPVHPDPPTRVTLTPQQGHGDPPSGHRSGHGSSNGTPDAGARGSQGALAREQQSKAPEPEPDLANGQAAAQARAQLRQMIGSLRQDPDPPPPRHRSGIDPPIAKPLPEPLSVEETERRRREQLAALEARIARK